MRFNVLANLALGCSIYLVALSPALCEAQTKQLGTVRDLTIGLQTMALKLQTMPDDQIDDNAFAVQAKQIQTYLACVSKCYSGPGVQIPSCVAGCKVPSDAPDSTSKNFHPLTENW